jgi:hypothetical protein
LEAASPRARRRRQRKERRRQARRRRQIARSLPWRHFFRFYPKLFKRAGVDPRLRTRQLAPLKLRYDTKLLRDGFGRFYLCLLSPTNPKPAPVTSPGRPWEDGVIALDPGVRTFHAGYVPTGRIVEWAPSGHPAAGDDRSRLQELHRQADSLQSKEARASRRARPPRPAAVAATTTARAEEHRQRSPRYARKNTFFSSVKHQLRKRRLRVNQRIRDKVQDVHKKFVKWLVSHFHTVLLPNFHTSEMTRRWRKEIRKFEQGETDQLPSVLDPEETDATASNPVTSEDTPPASVQKTSESSGEEKPQEWERSKLTGPVRRDLNTWSHYRFKMRLLDKTREFPWCRVVICDEHYTSKTCSECGELHDKLGGSKTFHCPQERCGAVMDRDHNGARNILLRFLTLNHAGDPAPTNVVTEAQPKAKTKRAAQKKTKRTAEVRAQTAIQAQPQSKRARGAQEEAAPAKRARQTADSTATKRQKKT